ncbi:MAG TPA: NADH:flavin oxidoreductase, partial [Steroidobacteraceae bacterium]|nr:NADH:flavin oxidoreductase [Steroidobacteraceae bacterium]
TTRRQFFGFVAASSVGAGFALRAPPARAALDTDTGRAHYMLFSPGKIGKMQLKNRVVRSAAFEGSGVDGYVTEDMIRFHRNYAEGGVALTLTGYMSVMSYGKKGSHVCASDDKFIPGLSKLAKAVHDADKDCKIGAEIGHDGTAQRIVGQGKEGPAVLTNPMGGILAGRIGPSGINPRGEADPEAHILTIAEIDRFTSDMADATRRLRDAGFDCVEIHGAHHYLINQFFSPYTNRRTDRYGGSLENRTRVVAEMVSKMRDQVGKDFPILIKLNCNDGSAHEGFAGEIDLQTFPQLANACIKAGCDAIDISGGEKMGDPMRMSISDPKDQSFYERYADALPENATVILGCGNRNVEVLEYILRRGKVDFFCLARPLFREPDLAKRWLEGRGSPQADCINSNLCFQKVTREGTPTRCVVLENLRKSQQT